MARAICSNTLGESSPATHPRPVRRSAARGGVRRGDAAHRAARHQGRRRPHPVPVGRRRPSRAATRPVGVAGRAALPPADRDRRQRTASTPTGSSTAARRGARRTKRTAETIEVIERANARLIHRLGVDDPDGNPTVADPACRKRSQPMRLAGTVNWQDAAGTRGSSRPTSR